MDFLDYNYSPRQIAEALGVAERRVRAAIEHIAGHRPEVDAERRRISERVNRPDSPQVEAATAKTPEELRRRIMGRRAGEGEERRRPAST